MSGESALSRALRSTPDLPVRKIHIGQDAAGRLESFAGTGALLIVSDEQTREVSQPLLHTLRGRRAIEHVYPGEGLDATAELAETLAEKAIGSDWIIGAGSGTVCDLAKYAGHLAGVPVALYGTAASMNGYTSGIAALKVRGLKRTLPCTPAAGVFADPSVLAGAPERMAAAGLADFLSKCSACADWRAANILRGEYFNEDALRFYEGLVDRVLRDAPKVGNADPDATAFLMEALLLSGLSMLMAGSSSPASGGEHLISHYVDMKSALNGTPHDLHGAQVGVATVHCLRLWEKITTVEPDAFDIESCVNAQPTDEDVLAAIQATWGGYVAAEVIEQWTEKSRDRAALRAELQRFQSEHERIANAVWQDLLPYTTVQAAIAAAGGPVTPDELTVPMDDYDDALTNARFIRNRFTILDLAAELCVD